ncbi:hypothetical protein JW935_15990 [candidate division KSB1 bacterium]|nr:hypothetical protein [candidate division KSB1 bacterium]
MVCICCAQNSDVRLRVESRGDFAVRLEPIGPENEANVKMMIDAKWNYPDLRWGNYMKDPVWGEPGETILVQIRLTDNDRYESRAR